MDTKTLLIELENVSHDSRVKRMVELGQRAKTDASTVTEIESLEKLGVYERRLALQSCFGSRDGAHILRAITDPSRLIRGLAISLVALACSDEQSEQVLARLSPKSRRKLAAKLCKAGRQTPLDNYVRSQADSDQLAALLPFTSPDLLIQYLHVAVEKMGLDGWQRFAKYYPQETLALLQREVDAAQELDRRLVWTVNAVIPLTAEREPHATLKLVQTLARHAPLSSLRLEALVKWLPTEMADLVLSLGDKLPLEFRYVGHKLDMDRAVALIQRGYITLYGNYFERLTPERRVILYHIFELGWRDNDGVFPRWILELLPREIREREARRHLKLVIFATRPQMRLPYLSFLPWSEAVSELDHFLRNPDPALRIAAWSALISTVCYQRERLSELLTMVRARRNEQDPVRSAIITGLSQLPPSVWKSNHLADLSQIMRDTLDAADISIGTTTAAESLITALLRFQPTWVVEWLPIFAKERGRIYLNQLETRFSDQDVQRLAPVLQPVLEAWETREREGHLITLAQSLGRRLRAFDGLVDILDRILRTTTTTWVANFALALIMEHRRERAPRLIPDLIRQDQSWVTQPIVYTYLHRHRQDLLTPFWAQQTPYRGRFSTGKTRFVFPFAKGFERWTPSQQQAFANTLSTVGSDDMRDMPAIMGTIHQLAGLMFISPKRVIALAEVDNERFILRDTALRALGRLDAGEGIPILVEAVGDERARIAIYALRAGLLEIPPDRALEILRTVPMTKVTVAKEVIRLIGELRTEAAYHDLLKYTEQRLHRDVQVALLRALWEHLQHERTWQILNQAAVDPDPAIATIVGRIPADKLSPDSQKRLVQLLVMLMGHPDSVVRIDVLRRCYELPLADPDHVLMTPLMSAVASPFPDESQAAAQGVFATYAGRNADIVAHTVAQLLPNRRALFTLFGAMQTAVRADRKHFLATVRAVLSVLEQDAVTAKWRVELAIHVLPWPELAEMISKMAQTQEFHADALAGAEQQLHAATYPVGNRDWSFPRPVEPMGVRNDNAEVAQLEVLLRDSPDAHVRRLGLTALIVASRAPYGWNPERLALLEIYGADPAPLVAAAAQFTFPPPV